MRTMSMSLRAIFIVGFVVAMPILALPAVARRMDEWLYGHDQAPLPAPAAPGGQRTIQVVEPTTVERASPASYVEVDVPSAAGGLGTGASVHVPDFPPHAPPPFPTAQRSPQGALSAAEMDRLREIRQRLEDLGAEYILLETTDGTGEYRFHCQMKVDADAPYTRDFEARGPDPLAAGEQVLAAASNWQAALVQESAKGIAR